MPSIEIACISLQETDTPPPASFAVVCERGLLSHRAPSPRFQADFDALSGCLYHLGPVGSFRAPALTLAHFWTLHDSRKLRLNAAYPISRAL